jgi:hypothetical protein
MGGTAPVTPVGPSPRAPWAHPSHHRDDVCPRPLIAGPGRPQAGAPCDPDLRDSESPCARRNNGMPAARPVAQAARVCIADRPGPAGFRHGCFVSDNWKGLSESSAQAQASRSQGLCSPGIMHASDSDRLRPTPSGASTSQLASLCPACPALQDSCWRRIHASTGRPPATRIDGRASDLPSPARLLQRRRCRWRVHRLVQGGLGQESS